MNHRFGWGVYAIGDAPFYVVDDFGSLVEISWACLLVTHQEDLGGCFDEPLTDLLNCDKL